MTFKTLSLLAVGEFRSGQDLAKTLGVSRGAIWYALRGVDELGIDVHKVRGRGYRLAQPLSLLDRSEILRELGSHASRFVLEVLDCTESTNSLLMARAASAAIGSVVAAEARIVITCSRLGRPNAVIRGSLATSDTRT